MIVTKLMKALFVIIIINEGWRWELIWSHVTERRPWGQQAVEGRILVLLLLSVPEMKNRWCYFKNAPYLKPPFCCLMCRSVAEGFSLMTRLGSGSEPCHRNPLTISPFSPTAAPIYPPVLSSCPLHSFLHAFV